MPYRYTSVVNAGVRAAAQVERHYRHQLALAIQRECRFSAARRSAIFGFVFGKMHEVLQMLRRVPSSYSGRENCRYFGEYPPRPSAGKACATGTGSHGSKRCPAPSIGIVPGRLMAFSVRPSTLRYHHTTAASCLPSVMSRRDQRSRAADVHGRWSARHMPETPDVRVCLGDMSVSSEAGKPIPFAVGARREQPTHEVRNTTTCSS